MALDPIVQFVSRLTKVKQTRPGSFVACCPAHEDKNPSMTVRELPDHRVLIHCFGGCEPESILAAVGMTFSDLFPEPLGHHLPKVSRPFSAHEALECLRTETAMVAICAADLREGKTLSEEDTSRLWLAGGRIATALEVVNGL